MVEHKGAVGTNGHCWTGRLLERTQWLRGRDGKQGDRQFKGLGLGNKLPKLRDAIAESQRTGRKMTV